MAWSIVIGVVNWWSGCKFLSHGCHCPSSPALIVLSPFILFALAQPFRSSCSLTRICISRSRDLSPPLSIRKSTPETFTVETHLIAQLKSISWNYSQLFGAGGTVCTGCQPTPSSENARLTWCRGAAAGADVPPNCSSRHAETILFKAFQSICDRCQCEVKPTLKCKSRFLSWPLNGSQRAAWPSEEKRWKGIKSITSTVMAHNGPPVSASPLTCGKELRNLGSIPNCENHFDLSGSC